MKPKSTLRHFLALAASSLLTVSSSASGAIRNWDGDTSATWATASNWDTAPANSLTTDIANFNLATYDGVTVFAPTVGTATGINGITIGAGNGTMTLTNTAALSIGNSGISIANGAGAFTISGSTTLGASQSWTNNSANLFTFGAVSAGANTLTIGGSGNTTASGIISGTNGALTKEGAGLLTLNAANTYTGATTVNGGELRWGINNAIAGGALNINNGGTVNMQTFTDTVGTITIAQGGSITGTTGTITTGLVVSNDGGTFSGFNAGAGLNLYGGITYNSTGPGSTTLQIDRIFVGDQGTTVYNIANGDAAIDFEITEILSGGGNNIGRTMRKTGSGVMQFSGSVANTTSTNQMPLDIWDGTVIFNKSAEVNAIPNSAITIGDGIGAAGSAMLQYRTSNNQIQNSNITINSDGLFDLNGKSETTGGALIVNDGSITTGAGTLTLGATTNTISGASTVTGNLTFTPGTVAATNLTLGGTASINGTTTFSGGNGSGITATGSTSIAGTLAFGSSTRTIAVTNASDTLAISANTTGSGAITKTGSGSLVLNGSNGYSGGTIVNAGTLQIGDGTTAGTMASGSALTLGNATFRVLAPASGGSSQTAASLATTASTGSTIRLTPGASGNTTLTITSNTLSTGAGSSLNFDYTAGTTVGGTVGNNYVVWNPTLTGGIIGAAYTVTDSGGTGYATTSGGNVVRLTDSGSAGLPVSGGSSTDSYFVASGYSTVSTTTPGSLVEALSGAVAASNVTVNTTGLASGANLALGTNLLTLGAGMVISGPNAYEISGSGAGGLKAAASAGTINLYNANTSTVTISAPIVANGASRLTVDGPGTTILSGVNTYTGATLLNGGITRFSGTMAASPITINNGAAQLGTTTGLTSSNTVSFGAGSTGSLQLRGNSVTIGALSSNATLGAPVITNNNGGPSVGNATLTIDSGSSTTFGGVIQDGTGGGTLALAKSGAGTLTLSGSSTYSGGTVINAGVVSVTADANLGDAGSGVTLNGGKLTIAGVNLSSARSVTVNGTGSSMQVNKNNSFSTSGALSGSGSLTFVDPGGSGTTPIHKFTSSGNTFTGTMTMPVMDVRVSSLGDTVGNNIVFTAAGTFSLNDTGATSGLTFNNRAIELSNTSATLSNLNTTHAITIGSNLVATGAGAKVLTLSAAAGPTNVFSGNITDGTGGGTVGITKPGAGTWILSNTSNSYTGGTTVSGGTLGFANGALGSSGTINASGGTLLWNTGNTQDISSRLAMTAGTTTTLNTNGNNVAFANPIGGSTTGALAKAGAGTLLLNGTNTYTGLTTVNDGTLGGSCTIAGAVTVNASGSLAPGASVGTLAINGALTLTNQVNGGTGKLKFELGSIAASDKITVGGNLTLGGNYLNLADFEFSTLAGLQNGTYPLITYTGTLSGNVGTGLVGTINGAGGSADVTLQINTTTKTVELVVSNVSSGSPYDTWSGGAPFGGDANGDGVSNGLAWLLGAADKDVSALNKLPTVSQSGGDLVLSFTCLKLAGRGSAVLNLQHSGDLGISDPWFSVAVPDTAQTLGGVNFTVPSVNADPNLVNLQAIIPAAGNAASGKLFGRLKAENP